MGLTRWGELAGMRKRPYRRAARRRGPTSDRSPRSRRLERGRPPPWPGSPPWDARRSGGVRFRRHRRRQRRPNAVGIPKCSRHAPAGGCCQPGLCPPPASPRRRQPAPHRHHLNHRGSIRSDNLTAVTNHRRPPRNIRAFLRGCRVPPRSLVRR